MARVGGGAYMPSFGMCAARLCHPRARFLAALGMTVGVAENDMRVGAYVRGWRIHAAVWHVCGYSHMADHAVIGSRSQTSQDDVCATRGRREKLRSSLPQSEIPRSAWNDRACG